MAFAVSFRKNPTRVRSARKVPLTTQSEIQTVNRSQYPDVKINTHQVSNWQVLTAVASVYARKY